MKVVKFYMRQYDESWLNELCASSYSYAEVLRKAGRAQGGGTQNTLKRKIREYNINIDHFTGQAWRTKSNNTISVGEKELYSLKEVFCVNSPISQKTLRGYVLRHNILEYKCVQCGCDGKWQNGIIALEIHHKNGDNTDNRIENLCYLCPNCHALTDTYRGKNISH